jgi:adenylate cyclase
MDMLAAPLIHVDLATERLWRDGVPVPVTRKVFRLLRTFVTRPGQLMTTEALLAEVWPNTHVAEGSVKDCVKQLRALLGDDVANPRFIETIRGRGYVFRGGIELLDEGQVPPGCPEVSPAEADASPALVPAPRTGRGRGAAAALWVATVVILLLVAVAGLRVGNVGPEAEAGAHEVAPAPDRSTMPVVAIMPFVPLSEGEQVQLLAGAFTTGVASALSRAHDLIVVRGPVADEHRKAAQDGSGNSITYVLSGAVQLEGEAVRLTAMLEDVATGRYLWSDQHDLQLGEVLALQDRVAQRVFSALRVHLVEGERARVAARHTESLEAWLLSHEAYGEYLKFDWAANRRARDLWVEAAALDPDYATPVAGLALTHWAEAKWGWSSSRTESLRTARELAERTIAINSDEPLGHQALGTILFEKGLPDEAIGPRMTAIELAPNDITAVAGLAIRLNEYGRQAEALPLFERSLRLAPRPPWWVHKGYGIALHLDGRPEEALPAYAAALAARAARPGLHARMAAAHADLGDAASAREAANRVLELAPGFSIEAFLATDGFRIDDINDWLADLMSRAGLPGHRQHAGAGYGGHE